MTCVQWARQITGRACSGPGRSHDMNMYIIPRRSHDKDRVRFVTSRQRDDTCTCTSSMRWDGRRCADLVTSSERMSFFISRVIMSPARGGSHRMQHCCDVHANVHCICTVHVHVHLFRRYSVIAPAMHKSLQIHVHVHVPYISK